MSTLQDKLHSRHIPALDALRAIAVFLVIAYHFGFEQVNGAMGVEIFFVLSGFLITWLLLKENDRTDDISFMGFYKRRALRIFPAFWAYYVLGFSLIVLKHQPIPKGELVSSLFYFSNYYLALSPHSDTYLGMTWSLSIEEQFYLLWPAIFYLFRHRLNILTKVLMGIIGCVWIYRAALFFGFHVNSSYIYHAFDTRADHLLMGCLLAVLLFRNVLTEFRDAICKKQFFPAITLCILVFLMRFNSNLNYRYSLGYVIEPMIISILIVQLINFSLNQMWKWMESPALSYLGRISYSLYLYQSLTLYTSRKLTASLPVSVQFIFAVSVTVAFASISYFCIEKPFLKLKDKKLSLFAQPAAALECA